ncbi:MAG TPA: type I-C CRISPR-associated endonuclease Cas1c [Candidatus Angelobacter sp.]|nr:type I-C CRISPR-associated endonuclease Cas1c [Candidatus Angelobacter sp.]
MKQLLNTLYVTTQGAYLSKDGETVLVRVEKETRLRVPVHTLSGIVCFGQVSCSPPLMGFCAEKDVALSFLTEHGKFLARVQGPVNGNVLLRREQYRRADDDAGSTNIARAVVQAKIANCRTVLLRGMREHGGNSQIEDAASRLARSIEMLETAQSVDGVRGIEGDGARNYFFVFDHLITTAKEHFFFRERSRRPPLDKVNALLSFLYTLLVHDIVGALETVGLDPSVGFLHRDRPGRPGLALDLMEELRPVLADRLALSLINRRQVDEEGFQTAEGGGVVMDDSTRKEVLLAWQKRKQEEIQHPFLGERVVFGLVPYVQALLLARRLRGDLDAYPAFFWR